MALKIAVLKERHEDERRVAVSPETVRKYIAQGCSVAVEAGAGNEASFTDSQYAEAGASIAKSPADVLKGAGLLLAVQAPRPEDIKALPRGAAVMGILNPYKNADFIAICAAQGVTAMSMELVPRITRAQSMDVLSSQSNLAGYKAVLEAATLFTRGFPMMMTAAGTVPPARVFVMGAGVAGLQAIATARRLGAIVSATDVRLAAKEQVQSLGASFVMVEDEETREAETSGGYAREMSDAYKKKQAALIEETIRKQDVVITTALIPGRPAPQLVTEAMVRSMKPGSVIVDLAVEQGGNCALSKAGQVADVDGVKIMGYRNMASRITTDASALYAKNLLSLFTLLFGKDKGELAFNFEDDIVKAITLTHGGKEVHAQFSSGAAQKAEKPAKKAAEAPPAKAAPKKAAAAKPAPKTVKKKA